MTFPSKSTPYAVRYVKHYRHGIRYTVDATVTTRMVQALAAIGYTRGRIAEETGLSKSFISDLWHGRHQRVRPDVVEAVAAAYGRLHMTPLDDPHARKVKAWAKRLGYAAPLAWDDITNPDELPFGRSSHGWADDDEKQHAIERVASGETMQSVARDLKRSKTTIRRWMESAA